MLNITSFRKLLHLFYVFHSGLKLNEKLQKAHLTSFETLANHSTVEMLPNCPFPTVNAAELTFCRFQMNFGRSFDI